MKKKRVHIVGAGNLGSSILYGLLKTDQYLLSISDRKEANLKKFSSTSASVFSDNAEGVKKADILIFCLQPGHILPVLKQLRNHFSSEQLIISTATGIELSELATNLPAGAKVVRAMPNTAASVKESMTCLSLTSEAASDLETAKDIFSCIGKVRVIDDELMRAATVLGASGIAFFMRFIRAATQGGIQMGFHPEEAKDIAVQTALGATTLLKEDKTHPEEEIDRVTTPRGCTIEGLNEMEHSGMSSALIKGIMSSYRKIENIR